MYIVFYINVIVQLNTSFIDVPNILGLELVPVQYFFHVSEKSINIGGIETRQPLLTSGLWTAEGEAAAALQEGGEPILPRHVLPQPGCRERAAETSCQLEGKFSDLKGSKNERF